MVTKFFEDFEPTRNLMVPKVFLRLSSTELELSEVNRTLDSQVQERTSKLIAAEAMLVNSAKFSALGGMAAGFDSGHAPHQ